MLTTANICLIYWCCITNGWKYKKVPQLSSTMFLFLFFYHKAEKATNIITKLAGVQAQPSVPLTETKLSQTWGKVETIRRKGISQEGQIKKEKKNLSFFTLSLWYLVSHFSAGLFVNGLHYLAHSFIFGHFPTLTIFSSKCHGEALLFICFLMISS